MRRGAPALVGFAKGGRKPKRGVCFLRSGSGSNFQCAFSSFANHFTSSCAHQLATALSLLLLSSPYYSLFSSLPVPDQTAPTSTSTFEVQMAVHVRSLEVIEEIISLRERVESDAVEKEVEKRRNRLDSAGKGKEVIRNEVGVEIWGSSLVSVRTQRTEFRSRDTHTS